MPARLAAAWRAVGWWVAGVLGEHRYAHYLQHHRRHGGGEALTEREFWRAEHARADREPGSRCC